MLLKMNRISIYNLNIGSKSGLYDYGYQGWTCVKFFGFCHLKICSKVANENNRYKLRELWTLEKRIRKGVSKSHVESVCSSGFLWVCQKESLWNKL